MGVEHKKKIAFKGLGWKIRIQQKRTNYFITLVKEVVLGNALKKGAELYYYLVECEGRKGLLIFLDEKERPAEHELNLKTISLKSPKKGYNQLVEAKL